MKRLKSVIIGTLALALSGCGQTVVETLHNTQVPSANAPGAGKSIVILPFADYSQGNLESARRRNMIITEALTDKLIGYGFGLPVQEDVFDYLVGEDVIRLSSYEQANTRSLANELDNDWSLSMKQEIQRYKGIVESEAGEQQPSPGSHGLTTQTVAKIGRHFEADYVIRGRILEFKTRDEKNWAPWKKGLLPFINGGANRLLNGFASSEAYDERNESLTGALLAGTIAHNFANWPFNDNDTIFGLAQNTPNAVVWMTSGYGVGKALHTSGREVQAAVQLRIWVQEASTGAMVWSNRIRVLVSPESILADNQYDTLFNLAIEKGVSTLMDNFVAYGL
ncbi:MAG: hypothetical protein CSB32_00690 [Desulfobacterales bacterium]|nr:MAG: hypothetical protein CSB32_00690 [Desulfobacterales bacterium]